MTRDIKSNLCSLSATPPPRDLFSSPFYIISFRVSCASFLGRHRRHLHGLERRTLPLSLSPLLAPVITATREEEEEGKKEGQGGNRT